MPPSEWMEGVLSRSENRSVISSTNPFHRTLVPLLSLEESDQSWRPELRNKDQHDGARDISSGVLGRVVHPLQEMHNQLRREGPLAAETSGSELATGEGAWSSGTSLAELGGGESLLAELGDESHVVYSGGARGPRDMLIGPRRRTARAEFWGRRSGPSS